MNIHRFNNFPINIKNSPAFGKKCLDDNIRIRRVDGTKSSCNFVEYERDNVKDIIHIENLEKLWGKKAVFINTIVRGFNNSNNAYYTNDSHLYALEDERGDTLAIAKVIDSRTLIPEIIIHVYHTFKLPPTKHIHPKQSITEGLEKL